MNIGFIGLGSIGYPIYRHVVENYPVRFYARRKEIIESAKADGGIFMPSNTALAKECDVILVFVNTFDQCKECVREIAVAKDKDVTIIIGATVSPTEITELVEGYPNFTILDAPVTGGVKGAIEGVLTTMLSGDKEAADKCVPIIQTYSKKIVRVDDKPGQAEVLKALVQLLVGINSVAMSEAMTITNSAGTSRIFENRGQKVMDRDFEKRGTIEIINKDLTIASKLAFDAKSPLFLGAIAKQMFQIAARQCDPLLDFNAVVQVYEDMAGVEIKRPEK